MDHWTHGLDVRAINYCIDQFTSAYVSLQVVLGHSGVDGDEELPLEKHGAEGGTCRRWELNDDDYIRQIEYSYDPRKGNLTAIKFLS